MDYIQLARWGLIEPKISTKDPEHKESGYWRITHIGKLFCENKITLPECAYVYNNVTYKWGSKQINIIEALGTKFNYQELFNI